MLSTLVRRSIPRSSSVLGVRHQSGGSGHQLGENQRILIFGGVVATLAAFGGYLLASDSIPAGNIGGKLHVMDDSLEEPEAVLRPDAWQSFPLQKREQLTADTALFRFSLPEKNQVLGLPVASCFVVKTPDPREEGKEVVRPYTPTTLDSEARGYFDVVVKSYENGAASAHFGRLQEGDAVEFKGPFKKIQVEANKWPRITMLAGGSGITPMYQVVKHLLRDPSDQTELRLVFANRKESDRILEKELNALAAANPRFSVRYITTRPTRQETRREYIDRDLLEEELPSPSNNQMVMVCGPPAMYKTLSGPKAQDKSQGELSGILAEMGFDKEQVFKF